MDIIWVPYFPLFNLFCRFMNETNWPTTSVMWCLRKESSVDHIATTGWRWSLHLFVGLYQFWIWLCYDIFSSCLMIIYHSLSVYAISVECCFNQLVLGFLSFVACPFCYLTCMLSSGWIFSRLEPAWNMVQFISFLSKLVAELNNIWVICKVNRLGIVMKYTPVAAADLFFAGVIQNTDFE